MSDHSYPTDTELDPDRKHPVITPLDWKTMTREGVFKNKAYPAQSRSQQRGALRERIQNALLDLSLLYDYLADDEREQTLEEWTADEEPAGDPDHTDSPDRLRTSPTEQTLADAIAFICLAAEDAGSRPAELIVKGFKQAHERRFPHLIADPELNINANPRTRLSHTAVQKMDVGNDLSDREIRALLETGQVDPADVAAYVRENHDTPAEGQSDENDADE